MAGSGVFSLETLKWCSDSVKLERNFDFMKMPAFREVAFKNFLKKSKPPFAGKSIEIFCSDKNEKAIKTIKHNAKDYLNDISISQADFFSLAPAQNALLVINPPYGKRMAEEKSLYKEIAKKIKKDFSKCKAVILCPSWENMGADYLPLQTYNGGLEIRVLMYTG
jgi:23S rRNA G2445 N2-methylase RlmL